MQAINKPHIYVVNSNERHVHVDNWKKIHTYDAMVDMHEQQLR